MKKFLSLVLALVLTLSLVVIPANAAVTISSSSSYSVSADKTGVPSDGTVTFTANQPTTPKVTDSGASYTADVTYNWTITGGTASDTTSKTCTVTPSVGATSVSAKCTYTLSYNSTSTTLEKSKSVTVIDLDSAITAVKFNSRSYTVTRNAATVYYAKTEETNLATASKWAATTRSGYSATVKSASKDAVVFTVSYGNSSKDVTIAITATQFDNTVTLSSTASSSVISESKVALTLSGYSTKNANTSYKWYQGASLKATTSSDSYDWTAPQNTRSTPVSYKLYCGVYEGSLLVATSNEITVSVVKDPYTIKRGANTAGKVISSLTLTDGADGEIPEPYLVDTKNTSATADDENITSGYTVSWKSSNTNVASVSGDATGATVKAGDKTGSATITATLTYDGKDYEITYSVKVTACDETLTAVNNGSTDSYSFSTIKSKVVSAINKVSSDTIKTTDIDTITVNDLPGSSAGTFYTNSKKTTELDDGDTITDTIYFEAKAGFIGQAALKLNVETKSDGEFTVTLYIPVKAVAATFASQSSKVADNVDVDVPTGYTEFYVISKNDKPDEEDYYDYDDGTCYDKDGELELDEDDFEKGKCVLYIVAIKKSSDVAYAGTLTVGNAAGDIEYNGVPGEKTTFDHSDFTAFLKEVAVDGDDYYKATFDHVTFDIPSTSEGVLYNNGTKISSSSTKITDLDKVTFIPAAKADDEIYIDFTLYATCYEDKNTATKDAEDEEYEGRILIKVASSDITYTVAAGSSVTFKESDFLSFFRDEYSKGTLDYVQFDKLPKTAEGKLYSEYNATSFGSTALKLTDELYYNASSKELDLNEVTFVPSAVLTANTTVYLSFTAYGQDKDDDDVDVSGVVAVKVTQLTMSFSDVKSYDWYYANLSKAYGMGLIDGYEDKTFRPSGNMTYAEAIVLACRMHQLYNDGIVTLKSSTTGNWYSSYMTYALQKGIISSDMSSVANQKISRKAYVDIFYNALPTSNYTQINTISKIPDLTENSANARIYAFYRAGILTGYTNTIGKTNYSFGPSDNISRAEVATILVRMMDASTRQYFRI